ncbi:metallophosphoesterase [Hymenobacter cellulosilyticus]|uniref:Metallophosphoesterase n=1 Tax=Hymenobacter cellulosilyticus TaxID=2932248 RepID=A0A8T9Q6M0_9BACT|nr:metallophosphoesterase [Hymenobacter cellulosilyticus]UOQ72755.1 metallophosphoesterase [Hymenobacter cellulosilyticus]
MRRPFLLSCLLLLCGSLTTALAQKTQTAHPERPNYNHGGENWESKTPPDSSHIRYSIFLIGDVGKPIKKEAGGEPSLNFLNQQITKAGSKSTTIFLGDNIYEYGMPREGAYDRKESEERMIGQLESLRGYAGEKYMIPGNHDWKQGLTGAVEQVNRQQAFVENYLTSDSAAFPFTGDFFIPRNACPGPFEVRLQDDILMIAINSQWFLQTSGERPYGGNSGCGVANETDFFTQLEDIIQRNQNRNIMVIAHHPIFSDGIHGGYFTLADHFFPLSIVYKYAFLPLPIIGSVYPFARKYGGVSQDIPHPLYQAYKKGLMEIFDKYPNIIYASGHEHNLQYFKVGSMHQIVSGSGCKTQHVRPGKSGEAIFSDKEKGWSRVNYYDNGEVWTEFWIPNDKGETGRLVFRTPLYAKETKVVAEIKEVNNMKRPNFQDSTVTLAVNTDYDQRGKFHRFLFGEHYRKEWATPVKFPVLDMATERGGLEPYKIGGGKQTASLKVRNEEGRNYTLRGLNKDPAAVLPEALREGAAKDILQDQISAQHPFGAFPVAYLGTTAGILHTNPKPVYIPQDPLLGQYYERFSNTPAMIEEDAKDDQSNVASLGNAENLVGTDKVMERLIDDNDNRVNEKAFARSRLFDMWIGDWDRHEDQWRWAETKDKDGDRKFTAVPEDRDIAFFKGDGVLPYLASRKWAIRNFQNFGYDYADFKGLNLTALANDRVFLASVSKEDWVKLAEKMKADLTDAEIEKAFRSQWPKEIYDLHGAEIVAKLKSRRDLLPKLAADYYGTLNDIVEVKGSSKRERFDVERLDGDKTRVKVTKINKEGQLTKTLFEKTFDKETDEIRLYGFSGNDVYNVTGQSKGGALLRIIGGTDRDSITDNSRVGGLGHKTQIYDADTGNVINAGKEVRLRLQPGIEVSQYDTHPRTDRKDYSLNYFGPALYFGYNIDDRLFLGGGVTYRTYGFRKAPFATEQTLAANYSPSQKAYNVRYTGQFVDVISKFDLRINAQLYGPQLLYNYFGEGNNSRNELLGSDDRVRNRDINDTYRVRFSRLYVSPVLERDIFSFLKVGIGPQYDQFRVEREPIGSEIARGLDANNNGVSGAGLGIRSSDFQLNRYLGGRAYLNIDAASSPKNPRIGLRWYNEVQQNYQMNAEQLNFGRITSEFRFYLSPNFPFQLTWAGRVGAARNWGDYRFYQANTLGGTTNLRGYRRTRYAGRSSVYANAEARLQLFSFNAYLVPGKFGILGLADAGRVYSEYDTRGGIDAFHTGFGAACGWMCSSRPLSTPHIPWAKRS